MFQVFFRFFSDSLFGLDDFIICVGVADRTDGECGISYPDGSFDQRKAAYDEACGSDLLFRIKREDVSVSHEIIREIFFRGRSHYFVSLSEHLYISDFKVSVVQEIHIHIDVGLRHVIRARDDGSRNGAYDLILHRVIIQVLQDLIFHFESIEEQRHFVSRDRVVERHCVGWSDHPDLLRFLEVVFPSRIHRLVEFLAFKQSYDGRYELRFVDSRFWIEISVGSLHDAEIAYLLYICRQRCVRSSDILECAAVC